MRNRPAAAPKKQILRSLEKPMAQWIYNFPSGLIDPGERPDESAKRELWEQTGLDLVRIDNMLDMTIS